MKRVSALARLSDLEWQIRFASKLPETRAVLEYLVPRMVKQAAIEAAEAERRGDTRGIHDTQIALRDARHAKLRMEVGAG